MVYGRAPSYNIQGKSLTQANIADTWQLGKNLKRHLISNHQDLFDQRRRMEFSNLTCLSCFTILPSPERLEVHRAICQPGCRGYSCALCRYEILFGPVLLRYIYREHPGALVTETMTTHKSREVQQWRNNKEYIVSQFLFLHIISKS